MNKRVLITGGSRGIGKALVRRFYHAGWQVAFCYQNSDQKANELLEECPHALAIKADVSDETSVTQLFKQITDTFGGLDALVCNAGIALPQMLLTDTSLADYQRVMDVNMKGVFLCCREATKSMVRQHQGAIVNISSVWGQTGGSCEAVYSASKGAVIAFSKALAKELGPSNIRVNCVCPGVIDTDMNAHLSAEDKAALADETPLMRLGTPEEIASAVLFLCSDEASFINGQVLGIDGGLIG